MFLWLSSQNGLFFDASHLHNATQCKVESGSPLILQIFNNFNFRIIYQIEGSIGKW
jgi:hypothetical protein